MDLLAPVAEEWLGDLRDDDYRPPRPLPAPSLLITADGTRRPIIEAAARGWFALYCGV
ncbi:hypothetical protein [Micromonospora eburnea]|uniref:hypothetical protein n=1 Tax=Micromonospora eburnea TaxID=227316 RepID=UPI001428B972|nr:hypothetical protein [Micromonospora eburnea]